MKTITTIITLSSLLFLVSCWANNEPMSEEEQAAYYNMSIEEFREMSDAAARMNMSIEEHMGHTIGGWHDNHWSMDHSQQHIIEED